MAKFGANQLNRDGVRSINSFFLYTLSAVLLAIVLIALSFILTGSYAGASGSQLQGTAQGGALVVFAMLAVAAMVLGIYGILSLMLGIRDLRRGSFRHAPGYASISRLLKYIIIATIFVDIIVCVLAVLSAISTLQGSMYGVAAAPSPYSGFLLAFTVVLLALYAAWAWELSMMYGFMASDLSQKGLSRAGTLLLAGIGVLLLGALLSAISQYSPQPSPGALVAFAMLLELVGIIVYASSLYLGFKATAAALR